MKGASDSLPPSVEACRIGFITLLDPGLEFEVVLHVDGVSELCTVVIRRLSLFSLRRRYRVRSERFLFYTLLCVTPHRSKRDWAWCAKSSNVSSLLLAHKFCVVLRVDRPMPSKRKPIIVFLW